MLHKHLPHIDGDGLLQFVTFRLADSLPSAVEEELRRDSESDPSNLQLKRWLESLDQGHGACMRWE
ncbi:MAG: hypothetical protein ABI743_15165 [bacterium]